MRYPKISAGLLGMAGLMLFVTLRTPLKALPNTIKVTDGTVVRLSLMDTLNSGTNKEDDPVHMEVMEDVKVGDVVVVTRGTTATGHVVEAEHKKLMGRGGKLSFTVDTVKAVDGTTLHLRANSSRKGQDNVSPLFLLTLGKEVNIAKGTQFNAYVDGDREVSIANPPTTTPAEPPSSPPATQTQVATTTPEVEPSTVIVKSNPEGADVVVDGKFVGSTPSTLRLAPGDHAISIEKPGFRSWQRTMSTNSGGIVTLDATLEKLQ